MKDNFSVKVQLYCPKCKQMIIHKLSAKKTDEITYSCFAHCSKCGEESSFEMTRNILERLIYHSGIET